MSIIRVWTIDGEWSKEFKGLDKIHLMKSAIEDACHICDKQTMEYLEDPLKGFEFNAKPIDADGLYEGDDSERENPVWRRLHLDFSSVETFKVPLFFIEHHESKCGFLNPFYDDLIEASKVPSPAPADYCLLFKFDDE